MHKRNNRQTEHNAKHRKQEFYMDHMELWKRVRRGITKKKQTYSAGQRQEVDAAKLDDLTQGAFIWGAESTPGGIRFFIQLPAGEVIALSMEGATDQGGDFQALRITKTEIR